MYNTMSITESQSKLRNIKIGLVDTYSEKVYYIQEGLHENLARDICLNKGYNWRDGGNFYSAVDYLLEKRDYVKISNYGSGNVFRCLNVPKKCKRKKSVSSWLDYLASVIGLRVDEY